MQIIRNTKNRHARVDFLFIYETKVREIESICLISQELESRGYSVGIMDMWSPLIEGQKKKLSSEVLLVSAVYSDKSLNLALSRVKGKAKVLNLQWEQVYCERDIDDPNSPWRMLGDTHKITHISWGNNNFNKLTAVDGIDASLVKKVGHVGLDFLRPQFRDYFLSREDILKQFDIALDNKVCLFISSFSFVKLPENIYEKQLRDFADISVSSQKAVINWIMRALEANPEITFIYRPHPAEAGNEDLLKLQRTNNRFKVIKEYSIKQWILIVDIIYNWYSTSMAEIYFAGKSCFMLRPDPMIEGFECLVLKDLTAITTYGEFEKSLHQQECNLPIPLKNITDNYVVDDDYPTYMKIADICEELHKSKTGYLSYRLSFKEKKRELILRFKNTKTGWFLLKCRDRIFSPDDFEKANKNDREYQLYVLEMRKNNGVTEEEFIKTEEKIKRVLQ